jgi:hypothetical protein
VKYSVKHVLLKSVKLYDGCGKVLGEEVDDAMKSNQAVD